MDDKIALELFVCVFVPRNFIFVEKKGSGMRELTFAIAGTWHPHAKDFPFRIHQRGGTHIAYRFAGVWAEESAIGKAWAKELRATCYETYEELLSIPGLDGVVITAGVTKHAEMIIAAAEKKINVFVEKPLTMSVEEAYRIQAVVKESGIHFTLSDPVKKPELMLLKRMTERGIFGDLVSIYTRQCHGNSLTDPKGMSGYYNKALSGGGAASDMGHHAIHLLYWFLGFPEAVCGNFSKMTELGKENGIDENSAVILRYPNGAIGIAESSWLAPGEQNTFLLYGTKGHACFDSGGLRYQLTKERDWVQVGEEELEEKSTYPMIYWAESILNNTKNMEYTIEEAVDFVRILSAAYTSETVCI